MPRLADTSRAPLYSLETLRGLPRTGLPGDSLPRRPPQPDGQTRFQHGTSGRPAPRARGWGRRAPSLCRGSVAGACHRAGAMFQPKRWSVQDSHHAIEAISRAALGEDELRLRRIRLDLAPEPQHLNVDRPIVDLVVVHAAGIQELLAGEDSLRGGQERRQQVELAVGQIDVAPVGALQPPGAKVELEAVEPISAHLALTRLRQRRALRAAQHGPDARQKLAW